MNARVVSIDEGVCVWLTGLSGAGKSTIARALVDRLRVRGEDASLLDGDELRASISHDLGFSKAHRDIHVMRVAALARQMVSHGEIVICALISPYRDARARARDHIGSDRFIEVFVDTPLEVCERRDPKGLYARARSGRLAGMTGLTDPYEPPIAPNLILTTVTSDVESNVARVLAQLSERRRRLGVAKSPRGVEYWSELPQTAIGKA